MKNNFHLGKITPAISNCALATCLGHSAAHVFHSIRNIMGQPTQWHVTKWRASMFCTRNQIRGRPNALNKWLRRNWISLDCHRFIRKRQNKQIIIKYSRVNIKNNPMVVLSESLQRKVVVSSLLTSKLIMEATSQTVFFKNLNLYLWRPLRVQKCLNAFKTLIGVEFK